VISRLDAEAHHEWRDPGCEDRNEKAAGEDGETGLERRPAAQLLHVEGGDELNPNQPPDQHHCAEVRLHERAGTEDAETDERRGRTDVRW
jgi:hypothetical protein